MDHFLDHFWVISGAIFGTVLGPTRAKKEPRWAEDGHEELQSTKSIIFKKCHFTVGKPYFSRLGGSPDEHKRLRKAHKRHLKRFKTS